MITAEELVLEINDTEEQKNFKLATVTALFENKTAKIQFDGEDTASEKQYAYLESYKPSVDDRVLLGVLGGTYVILGKVNYNVSPPAEAEIDRYLFDLKKVIIQKGLSVTLGLDADTLNVSGSTTLSGGATVVGNVGVNGDVNAVNVSATGGVNAVNVSATAGVTASGQVKGGSLSTTGTLSAGVSDLDSLDVSGTSNLNNTNVSGIFLHKGGFLSFFNKGSSVARQSIGTIGSTATLENVKDRLNDLIYALDLYGLIRRV